MIQSEKTNWRKKENRMKIKHCPMARDDGGKMITVANIGCE